MSLLQGLAQCKSGLCWVLRCKDNHNSYYGFSNRLNESQIKVFSIEITGSDLLSLVQLVTNYTHFATLG